MVVKSGVGSLKETPTWAVAIVCFILIVFSILMEHSLNRLSKFLKTRQRKSLIQALDKVKAELMLFGFMTLLLTVLEQPISKICIPKSVGETFLPCANTTLASDIVEEPVCQKQGKISLLSRNGVNQLQTLMFLLAFFHVLSCVITFALGMAKMKRWESWEEETKTLEYQFSNDPRRFRLTQQTSFGRRHLKFWSEHHLLLLPVCFLRLFNGSVSKADYFTLRHGFIMAHISQASKFDFHKFLRRSLDEDFVAIAGIRFWIWTFTVLFIFFSAYRFHNYLWLPFIPFLMVLVVGTKLQVIITKMFLETRNESTVVRGTFLVKPSDHFFWLERPQFLLYLIHFILFQNSFQQAFFTWTWYKFGFRSCFHKETEDIIIRIVMSVLVQILIGYVILPLYGLVTQMGTSMRKEVFTERVADGLTKWHTMAKRNMVTTESNSINPSQELSPSRAILSDIHGPGMNYINHSQELSPSRTLRDIHEPEMNSINPSQELSPSRTTISDTQELEMTETEGLSQNIEFLTVHLNREEAANSNTSVKEINLGEFSFRS